MADMEERRTPETDATINNTPALDGTMSPASNTVSTERDRGWLLPTLLDVDTALTGRWDYLTICWQKGELIDHPIPRVHFLEAPDKDVWKMLTASLDAIPNHGSGSWMGWSSSEYFRFFMEWLLHGFGHQGHMEAPKEPFGCEGASERLTNVFDLALLQEHPYDYLGNLLAENAYGKHSGFFPTPHSLSELMVQMTIGMSEGDTRVMTVMDPCVGTGRLLLHASNYSLRLYGQEINATLCLATLVNAYMFAPWLVRPLPFLDYIQYQPEHSAKVSEAMTAQAPPHQAEVLAGTEHDTEEQFKFEPVKKRRRKEGPDDEGHVKQGILF